MKNFLTSHNFKISFFLCLICTGLALWLSNAIGLIGSGNENDVIRGMQTYQTIALYLIPLVLIGLPLFFWSLKNNQPWSALLYVLGFGFMADAHVFPLVTGVVLCCALLVVGLKAFKHNFFNDSISVNSKFKTLATTSYYLHFVPLFALFFCGYLFAALTNGYISLLSSPLFIIPFLSVPVSLVLLLLHIGCLLYGRYKHKDYLKSTNWVLVLLTLISLMVSVTTAITLAVASMF